MKLRRYLTMIRMTNPKSQLRGWSSCFFWFLFSFVFFTACSDQKKDELFPVIFFDLDDFTSIPDSSLSIDHWIPLETVATNLMGMDLRVKFADTLIYVMDESVKDGIHVFGISGAYIKSIANVGEGPGSLPSLDDFEAKNNGLISVLSTIGDRSDVYTISLDGVLTKRFELNYIATSFADLDDQGFLFYGGFNLPFVTHRVIKTDTNGLILNQYLENEYQNSMLPMSERNFFASDSGVYM
ncbi:6-bladed beta-propeller [Aquiflexum sp. LQ15W]|uniref:6-bladed beta-propeller n=1 Tax=Cognataquiflexum nitidum TaxID=2922272 RepID=UPI001F130EA7|nr:6-bladed beta-propeller [Cognataquiflexum nitidum]MCH6200303.1 6-bladed beta-propeller [Cognataquiflexum nitidum]